MSDEEPEIEENVQINDLYAEKSEEHVENRLVSMVKGKKRFRINGSDLSIHYLVEKIGIFADVFAGSQKVARKLATATAEPALLLLRSKIIGKQVMAGFDSAVKGTEVLPKKLFATALTSLEEFLEFLNNLDPKVVIESNKKEDFGQGFDQIIYVLLELKQQLASAAVPQTGLPSIIIEDEITAALYHSNRENIAQQNELLTRINGLRSTYLQTVDYAIETIAYFKGLVISDCAGNVDNVKMLVRQICEIVKDMESAFSTPPVTISICGETCSGKTTLMEGIAGAACFPTDANANTACPIRMLVEESCSEPQLIIPDALLICLNLTYKAIAFAVLDLQKKHIPLDLPHHITSKEAVKLYEDIKNNVQEKIPDLIVPSAAGSENVLNSINLINGLIRLFYGLLKSARFHKRLQGIDPFLVFKTNKTDIISFLPIVLAKCPIMKMIPASFGAMSFIDTPGISESSGTDSFMAEVRTVVKDIFAASARIVILTTPTTKDHDHFKTLRDEARTVASGRVLLVVNKFEPEIVGVADPKDLERVLDEYRRQFEHEGFARSDVQFMRAKILHETVWGREHIGRMEDLKADQQLPNDAELLLQKLFGEGWRKGHFVRKYPVITDSLVDDEARALALKSNFGTVMSVCVLPSVLHTLGNLPKKFLGPAQKICANARSNLLARLRLVQNRSITEDLLKTLQTIQDQIRIFLSEKNLHQIREVIEKQCEAEFITILKRLQPEILSKAQFEVTKIETPLKSLDTPDIREEFFYYKGQRISIGNVNSYVRFPTEAKAKAARDSAINAANKVFWSSKIESAIELARPPIVSAALVEACSNLESSISQALASYKLINFSELDEFYSAFKNELRLIPELITFHVDPAPTVNITECYGSDYYWYWIIFWKYYYFTMFEAIRCQIRHAMDDHYNPEKYSKEQIARGRVNLVTAIKKFGKKLDDISIGYLSSLIVSISENLVNDDPAELQQLLDRAESLINRTQDLLAQIKQHLSTK